MGRYIGLDLGTTSITALLVDTSSGNVLVRYSTENDTEVTSAEDRSRGRSEWDIDQMVVKVLDLLGEVVSSMADATEIDGIGITGQQHGMVLLDADGNPAMPFIGWQDRRCHDIHEEGRTYLDSMIATGGIGFTKSEYLPARGYMGSTLYWLSRNHLLPVSVSTSFGPDYLVSRLCDQAPVTDPTNAAGSGLYDVIDGRWNTELLFALGIPKSILPDVKPNCTWAGTLSKNVADRTGLPEGLPVTNAVGDNQASFAGSVSDYESTVLVNIGTGGQISVFNHGSIRIEGMLVRPYLKDGFLLVGAGMTGGRSYAVLEQFIARVGASVFNTSIENLYDRLNDLASEVPPGSGGLRCEPIFTGSLSQPKRRGLWSGISDSNLTPGHMARSLLEGMATQFHNMYEGILSAGVVPRTTFVGAGNGIRKNQLLVRIFTDVFGLPLHIVRHTEEAAFGAALSAAVASKEFTDIEAAGSHCIVYDELT